MSLQAAGRLASRILKKKVRPKSPDSPKSLLRGIEGEGEFKVMGEEFFQDLRAVGERAEGLYRESLQRITHAESLSERAISSHREALEEIAGLKARSGVKFRRAVRESVSGRGRGVRTGPAREPETHKRKKGRRTPKFRPRIPSPRSGGKPRDKPPGSVPREHGKPWIPYVPRPDIPSEETTDVYPTPEPTVPTRKPEKPRDTDIPGCETIENALHLLGWEGSLCSGAGKTGQVDIIGKIE